MEIVNTSEILGIQHTCTWYHDTETGYINYMK